jgi:basic membrane protein A and related proteins
LVTAGEIGTAIVLDLATQEEKVLFGHTDWVYSVGFSPDGKWIATSSKDWTIIIWDADTGQEISSLLGHNGSVRDVAFDPNSKLLATAGEDGRIFLWEVGTWEILDTVSGHIGSVNGVTFSPDGMRLASAGDDRTVKVWDLESLASETTLIGHTNSVWKIAYSPDGNFLFSSGFDNQVVAWNANTDLKLFNFVGHSGPVTGFDISSHCKGTQDSLVRPCRNRLATASWDGTVKVWNASLHNEFIQLFSSDASVVRFNQDGSLLAAGTDDGRVEMIEIASLYSEYDPDGSLDIAIDRVSHSLPGHTSPIVDLAFSPVGTHLATAGEDGKVIIWDYKSGTELDTFRDHSTSVNTAVFSPDGQRLLVAGDDFLIMIHDLAGNGARSLHYYYHERYIPFAFSPDGLLLTHGSKDGTFRIIDVVTGVEKLTITGHAGAVVSMAFSLDGSYLATSSDDETVKVWDSENYHEIIALPDFTSAAIKLVFNQDSTKLAIVNNEGVVKVIDVTTWEEEISIDGSYHAVADLAFDPINNSLLRVTYDGRMRQTVLPIEELIDLAIRRVTRNLTNIECQQYFDLIPEHCPQDSVSLVFEDHEIRPEAQEFSDIDANKICQITDEAGLFDKQFNQVAYKGLKEVERQFGWTAIVLEANHPRDYPRKISRALNANCDLIYMSSGFSYFDLTKTAAEAYPHQKFLIPYRYYEPSLDNLWVQGYSIEQAAFLAGYVAASVSKTGRVGTFGGVNFPVITDFMDAFAYGVKYYNEKHHVDVRVIGWDVNEREGLFLGDFTEIDKARELTEKLINEGTDIIFPVAGRAGFGAALAANEHNGVYIIGVDSDWVETYPMYAHIILTSVELRLDVSVRTAVESIIEGTFTGGMYYGTLENGGVSIAPFHQLDHLVSPSIKMDLEEIKAGIISGEIQTIP